MAAGGWRRVSRNFVHTYTSLVDQRSGLYALPPCCTCLSIKGLRLPLIHLQASTRLQNTQVLLKLPLNNINKQITRPAYRHDGQINRYICIGLLRHCQCL